MSTRCEKKLRMDAVGQIIEPDLLHTIQWASLFPVVSLGGLGIDVGQAHQDGCKVHALGPGPSIYF